MKHFFILNPTAGKTDRTEYFTDIITKTCTENELDFETTQTQYQFHASALAKEACEKYSSIRIYVFGGDGTLSEVIRGCYSYKNCEVGVFPCGTGNDFVRSISKDDFDVETLIKAPSREIDLLSVNDTVGINIASIGFDAEVARNVSFFKKYVSGGMAYNMSLAFCFLTKTSFKLSVTVDDKKLKDDEYIFVVAANGKYYGGGFNPAPNANITDGLLDFVLIKKVSRMNILKLVKKYKDGTHTSLDIVKYFKGEKIVISSKDSICVNLDGEVTKGNIVTIKILKKSLKFIIAD